MILMVVFDLPRLTAKERREATKYQKFLLSNGFQMEQFSVYVRHLRQANYKERLVEIISSQIPKSGQILLFELSDAVYNEKKIILGEILSDIELPKAGRVRIF